MKHVKKLFAMLMAVMMLVGLLSVTSFADETKYDITAPANGRDYAVYQIMTGDLSTKDNAKVLSNVQWGTNAAAGKTGAVSKDDMTAITNLAGSEAEKAAALAAYVNFDSNPVGTVTNGGKLAVAPGYYLIKDNGPVADKEAYSLYIVQVVGDTTIQPKVGETTSDKKVDDKNDSNDTEDATTWQDSADYDIGDDVPFRLTAKITERYADFGKYQLTFHDNQSAGLTFKPESVKVYVDDSETPIASNLYSVTENTTDGCTFEIHFDDLKNIPSVKADSVIAVEYLSTLNKDAKIGAEGNPNTSHITYSNNPNNKQGGEEGKTPEDKVIVFTYKVVANKVDGESKPLTGAEFTLYKKNAAGNYVEVTDKLTKNAAGTEFAWTGIDDGDYKLSETTTPAGYNTADDILFTVTAGHEILSDDPALTSLSGEMATGSVITLSADKTAGTLSGTVVNQAGSTLPETGGVGTYIFYAVGGVLVLAAVVLFVTKKRMSDAD